MGLVLIVVGAGTGVITIVTTGSLVGSFLNMFWVGFVGAGLIADGLWRTASIPRNAAHLMGLTPLAAAVGILGSSQSTESFMGLLGFGVLILVWNGAWIFLGYHLWQQKPESSATA